MRHAAIQKQIQNSVSAPFRFTVSRLPPLRAAGVPAESRSVRDFPLGKIQSSDPMRSKALVRERAVKWPLIAATVAALSAVSAVALVAAVAWTTAAGCGAPRTPTEHLHLQLDTAVVVNETEFDSQSGKS